MATNAGDERLMDHSYDGIQEYDNPLPRWWVWIFYATIVFAVVYVIDPMGNIKGPGRIKEYQEQLADAAKRWPAPVGEPDAATLAALAANPTVVAEGKQIFTTNCAVCHRPDAGGNIGPNLTDEYWLHGGTLAEIRHTVFNGVLEKGMPPWGKMLKPEQVNAAAVYVASLRGSNPANPKPPQGEKLADTSAAKGKK